MERRTFLVLGAAAFGLAGCTSGQAPPSPPSAPAPSTTPMDPDSRVREEVAVSEISLIAAYRSAIGDNPELAEALTPFIDHHEQHLARVAPGFEVSAGPASSSASPSGPESSAEGALAALAVAESEAQSQRASACDGAQDPALARDLCLIAASEAQHAVALDDLAGGRSGP